MDKRIKYSISQKAAIVRSIEAGKLSHRGAARKVGCDNKTIRRWLQQYKQHGIKGLKFRNGGYDGKFKVAVVHYYFKKGLSLNQTASYFKIPNEGIICQWVKIYKRLGASGLSGETRGRKRSSMAKKPPKEQIPPNASADQKLAEMQKELDYLRAENAFLKKLEALVQQEEAAKAQAKRPKSSGN
jgi:transposase